MREVSVTIKLRNAADLFVSREPGGTAVAIRQHEMLGIVDTGAVSLALPQDVVDKLGLQVQRKVVVSYADARREQLDVAGPVNVAIGDRDMTIDCVVLPPTADALVGQVILETLDLIVDRRLQTLTPRPESPIFPLQNLK